MNKFMTGFLLLMGVGSLAFSMVAVVSAAPVTAAMVEGAEAALAISTMPV